MLDLRLLPDSSSGAGASALPLVMDIKFAAAVIAGLLVNRQYAKACQCDDLSVRAQDLPELTACNRADSEAGDIIM